MIASLAVMQTIPTKTKAIPARVLSMLLPMEPPYPGDGGPASPSTSPAME